MVQQATITQIQGDVITAELSCSEACGACAVKSLCGATAKKELTLLVDRPERKVGSVIWVEVTKGAGLKAVAIVYLAPVFLMLGILIAGEQFGWLPWATGIGALGVAGLYFLIVKLAKVGKGVEITIID